MKTKKRIAKFMTLFVAVTMMLSTFMVSVSAAEAGGDSSVENTGNPNMPKEGTLTLKANTEVSGKQSGFSAYKVLEAVSYEGQDVYEYKFTEDFKDFAAENKLTVDHIADTADGNPDYTFKAESADQLASKLEDYVKTKNIKAENETAIKIGTPAELPAGYYFILETGITDGYKTTKPILVAIPSENPATEDKYDVTVTLKDQPLTTTKTIKESEEKRAESATVQVGTEYTFEIVQQVPKYDDTYKNIVFRVTDILSKGLDFVDLVSVEKEDASGQKTGLILDETTKQYGYTVPTKNADGTTTLTIDFSDYSKKEGEDTNDYYNNVKDAKEVIITYTAKLNKDASFGPTGNPNTVQATFGDYADTQTEGTKDVAVTYAGLLELKKVGGDEDNDGTPDSLEGAEFTVYENAELTQEAKLVTYTVDQDGNITETKNEELSAVATTDKNGVVRFEGLGDRVQKADESEEEPTDYWIMETKAPNGYVKLKEPIELVVKAELPANVTDGTEPVKFSYEVKGNGVDKDSVEFDEATGLVTFTVNNVKGFTLPVTGGVGRIVLLVCGIVTFFAAVVMFGKPRKK